MAGRSHPIEFIELIPSGGGIFDVHVDGDLIFSKKKAHRHADADEVLEVIRQRLS